MLQTHAPSLCDGYVYVLFLLLYQFIDASVASTAVHVFTICQIFQIYSVVLPIINIISLHAVFFEHLIVL